MAASSSRGFSTIEVMVALVVFTIGVLGAAGTVVLAWRTEMAGERASVASRVAGSVLDSLRTEVLHRQGRCTGMVAGADSGPHGTSVSWRTRVSAGGREIWLTLSFASLAAIVTDTVWSFVPCR